MLSTTMISASMYRIQYMDLTDLNLIKILLSTVIFTSGKQHLLMRICDDQASLIFHYVIMKTFQKCQVLMFIFSLSFVNPILSLLFRRLPTIRQTVQRSQHIKHNSRSFRKNTPFVQWDRSTFLYICFNDRVKDILIMTIVLCTDFMLRLKFMMLCKSFPQHWRNLFYQSPSISSSGSTQKIYDEKIRRKIQEEDLSTTITILRALRII